jgi:tripartite-type tricarboxylate transporter receptor subunit TctC
VIQHIHSGGLRAIAVSSVRRSRSLPDVPTVAEKGFPVSRRVPGSASSRPRARRSRCSPLLNKAVNEVLPSLEAQMIREGADPVGGSSSQFAVFVHKEYEKWKVIVRESKATAE